jgi:hypothetical protein
MKKSREYVLSPFVESGLKALVVRSKFVTDAL